MCYTGFTSQQEESTVSRTEISDNGTESTYDDNGKLIHARCFDGFEAWFDYDFHGKLIHRKYSDGFEIWNEYDEKGNRIHFRDSYGYERWYDSNGKKISKEEFAKLFPSN